MSSHEVVSAEAVLRSKTGRSLVSSARNVTSENVEDYLAAESTRASAKRELERLGFVVSEAAGPTLTISGSPALFKTVFGVTIHVESDPAVGTRTRVEGQATLPGSLREVMDTVVFPEPPEFFP